MSAGIYVIARRDVDRFYIGSAVDIRNRWSVHRCRLRKGNHHSPQLQVAWNKHGDGAFEFAILETVASNSLLIEREQVWLDRFHPYYNTCKTAGSALGHIVSAATRAKISAAHKGRKNGPMSEETRKRLSAANSGRKLSEAHRRKLALAKIGRKRGPYSAQHKANISAAVTLWHKERRA